MISFEELSRRSNATGVTFVFTELDVALSFLRIAESRSPQDRLRLYTDADKAIRTALHSVERLTLSRVEAVRFQKMSTRAMAALQQFHSRWFPSLPPFQK